MDPSQTPRTRWGDAVSSDVWLHILSYLPARDAGKAMSVCRRFTYLVDYGRETRDPELVCFSTKVVKEMRKRRRKEQAAVDISQEKKEDEQDEISGRYPQRRNRGPPARLSERQDQESTEDSVSPREVLQAAMGKMVSPPNVAFVYYTGNTPNNCHGLDDDDDNDGNDRREGPSIALDQWMVDAQDVLPSETVILAARSDTGLQCNMPLDAYTPEPVVECDSNFSVMLGSFPQTTFVPFDIDASEPDPFSSHVAPALRKALSQPSKNNSVSNSLSDAIRHPSAQDGDNNNQRGHEFQNDFWKVFILHTVGNGFNVTRSLMNDLSIHYPSAAIVGGACPAADVRLSPATANGDMLDAQEEETRLRQKKNRDLRGFISNVFGHQALRSLSRREQYLEAARDALATLRSKRFRRNTNGVSVMAIGGRAPALAVSSRGVRSNLPPQRRLSAPWLIHESELITNDMMETPVHVIKSVKSFSATSSSNNNKNGDGEPVILNGSEFLQGLHKIDYIGIERPNTVGYELQTPIRVHGRGLEIEATSGSPGTSPSLVGSKIDSFVLDDKSCMLDVERSLTAFRASIMHNYSSGHKTGSTGMSKVNPKKVPVSAGFAKSEKTFDVLKSNALSNDFSSSSIVGAMMFLCCGRGPKTYFLPEEMADARTFAKVFGKTPAVGFYAEGEIGPAILAHLPDDTGDTAPPRISGRRRRRATSTDEDDQDNQQTGDTSRTVSSSSQVLPSFSGARSPAFQSFTAVFLAFVAPGKDSHKISVDDSLDNVRRYMELRLQSSRSTVK